MEYKKIENKQIYCSGFVKKVKFMYLNAHIPTALSPSLSPRIRFRLSLSLSPQIPEQSSLSLSQHSLCFPFSPKPPTHSSPLSQSPPFLLGRPIILFVSPSLHPTVSISLNILSALFMELKEKLNQN